MDSQHLVHMLMKPESYPWHPVSVELIETHISWVFLAGDRVVKVKRPVDLGFVDHTTLESRRHSCEEEVRLNRRLTSNVYLGVVGIDSEGIIIDRDSEATEWATLMRRLPASAMLDVLIRAGQVPDRLADRLADRLIPFHRDLAAVPGAPSDVAGIVTSVVLENLDELAAFPVAPVEFGLVATSLRRFITDQPDLMAERSANGWIRDGHGDLRCEHVSMTETHKPDIIDCIEFSPALRTVDIASDLAFLLMDLDRLGAGAEAEKLLARYRQSGFDLPDDLLRFYWAHRALVRAKVWYLRAPELLTYADRAMEYVHLALRQAISVRPALVCMTGLSGTGKSVIAGQLATVVPVTLITSDQLRKELASVDGRAGSDWETGIYTGQWTDATYDEMFQRARTHLASGRAVLLDATFLDAGKRDGAAALARELGVHCVLVETTGNDEEVRRRLAARAAGEVGPSDAGVDVYERQLARARNSPPGVPTGVVLVSIDTTARESTPLEPVFDVLASQGIIDARIPDTAIHLCGS